MDSLFCTWRVSVTWRHIGLVEHALNVRGKGNFFFTETNKTPVRSLVRQGPCNSWSLPSLYLACWGFVTGWWGMYQVMLLTMLASSWPSFLASPISTHSLLPDLDHHESTFSSTVILLQLEVSCKAEQDCHPSTEVPSSNGHPADWSL